MASSEQQQPQLFSEAPPLPDRIGECEVSYRDASSILTRATGFMSDYDFTLNPYSGCGFGCTYCYAAFFARDTGRIASWGQWVDVKQNALTMVRRMRTPLEGKTIYMSSVTDPYQPIENRLGLVRDLLAELAARGARLVVQTRSPLVVRDLDVLDRFAAVRVNMTVTTDSEDVRKAFEPTCPSNQARLKAITAVREAGIESAITMTPLLPVEDPVAFASSLKATGVERFVVQSFTPNAAGSLPAHATPRSRSRTALAGRPSSTDRPSRCCGVSFPCLLRVVRVSRLND